MLLITQTHNSTSAEYHHYKDIYLAEFSVMIKKETVREFSLKMPYLRITEVH